MATIEQLLEALNHNTNSKPKPELTNSKETWSRIARRDTFDELGLGASELSSLISEFISNNPYSAIA